MKAATETLRLKQIRLDGGTQIRAELNQDTIKEYRDAMQVDTKFPPVEVVNDGSNFWMVDGFHRYHGRQQAGFSDIECKVYSGTQQDAVWRAIAANQANGLHRSNEDKRRAVLAAFAHPNGLELSDRLIAEHCGVSTMTASRVRKELAATVTKLQLKAEPVTSMRCYDGDLNEVPCEDDAGEPEETPDPPKRTGKDGKKRAAPKPKKKPKPAPRNANEDFAILSERTTALIQSVSELADDFAEAAKLHPDKKHDFTEAVKQLRLAKKLLSTAKSHI